ncbi:MAG: hypothetical protein ABI353_00465 [Isosphaeraceae bacterium]
MNDGNGGIGKREVGRVEILVEERPGWIRVHAVFPTEFQRQVELERLPGLIDRTLTDYLSKHTPIKVRAILPIHDDGFTIAVHLWYDLAT